MSNPTADTARPASPGASGGEIDKTLSIDQYSVFFRVVTNFYPEFLRVFPECEEGVHPGIEKIVLYTSEHKSATDALNGGSGADADADAGEDSAALEAARETEARARGVLETDEDVRVVVAHATERLSALFNLSLQGKIVEEKALSEEYADLFDGELLPGIDFRRCWNQEGVTDSTRSTLWTYVRTMMFSLLLTFTKDSVEDAELSEEQWTGFFEKLCADVSNADFSAGMAGAVGGDGAGAEGFSGMDFSGVDMSEMPTMEEMNEKFGGLMKGKLGKMAAEIASETAGELSSALGVDFESLSSPDQLVGALMQNPAKMMSIVKTIEGKMKEKMARDDISEADMMKEAMEMMTNMGSMPGMPGMGDIMKNMMGGAGAAMFGGRTESREEIRKKLQRTEREPAEKSTAADRERYLAQLAAAGGGAGKKRTNNKKKGKKGKKGKGKK
jgi:hypothetical protein